MELANTLIALSGQQNVVVVYRSFFEFTGSLEAAMMLSQLLYWTPRSRDGFVAKSDNDFSEELCLTKYGIRSARETLERMGLLETKIRKFAGIPKVHYRMRLNELETQWEAFLRKQKVDFAKTESGLCEKEKSLIETTIENTIEDEPVYEDLQPAKKGRRKDIYQMAQTLAEVCGMPFQPNEGYLLKEARLLLADNRVCPEIIRRDYLAGGAWYSQDWRGRKGDKPRPSQIRETLLTFQPEPDRRKIVGSVKTREIKGE